MTVQFSGIFSSAHIVCINLKRCNVKFCLPAFNNFELNLSSPGAYCFSKY